MLVRWSLMVVGGELGCPWVGDRVLGRGLFSDSYFCAGQFHAN